jgi:methionyl-tRNA synthetase
MVKTLSRPTAIIAPPPTPNGDLHVGHLSGPYFGADVLRRYLELRGTPVVSALSVDLNQTYVVTTAERLGTDPAGLAARSHADVTATLQAADIQFGVVGMPDADYDQYILAWFRKLHAANVFSVRRRKVPYDPTRRRFMFESYASGWCPVCLSDTKGNICEACGHPNDAAELLGLYPTGGKPGDTIEMREITEYVLDLERYRASLEHHLRRVVPELRPALARLVEELFAKPLPAFPITFASKWGIAAPFPDSEGLVLNVWAEMVPGHYYWLEAAHRKQGKSEALVKTRQDYRYVQYLGFDNSFFYVFAHLALALAAREAGIEALVPDAYVTNEFYLLDNFKFSTSQGHLIWGRDFLRDVSVDEARFHLSWSNPEYNQANFSRDDFERVVAKKFRAPLDHLMKLLGTLPGAGAQFSSYSRSLLSRFEDAYEPERSSLRIAALSIANGLVLASALQERGEDPQVIRGVAQALAAGMAPITPTIASKLWQAAGGKGALTWPGHLQAEDQEIRNIA